MLAAVTNRCKPKIRNAFHHQWMRWTTLPVLVIAIVLAGIRVIIPDLPVRAMTLIGYAPGFQVLRFANETWTGDSAKTQFVSRIDATKASSQLFQDNHFSLQFDGFIHIPETQRYQFELQSDDGSSVLIANQVIVADPGLHPMRPILQSRILDRGWHPIRIKYFNRDADAGLKLSWAPSGKNLKVMDAADVFSEPLSQKVTQVFMLLQTLLQWEIIGYILGSALVLLVMSFYPAKYVPGKALAGLGTKSIQNLIPGILLFLIFATFYHYPSWNPVSHGFAVIKHKGFNESILQSHINGTNGQLNSVTNQGLKHVGTELLLRGYLNIDTPGEYGFSLQADDEATLIVDGNDVLSSSIQFNYHNPVNKKVRLFKGIHELKIDYKIYGPPSFIDLKWAQPGSNVYRPIPVNDIFQTIPSPTMLETDRFFTIQYRLILSGFFCLFLLTVFFRIWRAGILALPAFFQVGCAVFVFLFLMHTPLMHVDHQGGLRWFVGLRFPARFFIALIVSFFVSGKFKSIFRQIRVILKKHPRTRFVAGLISVCALVAGQSLFVMASHKSGYTRAVWLFAGAAAVLLFSGFRPARIRRLSMSHDKGFKRWRWFFVICIILWASWVRFYRIHEMPPGLWWDEAQTGRVVRGILEGEIPPVYDLRINAGTIASYFNAGWCYLLDSTAPWSLRSYTAFIGVLTVLASWLFFRELFNQWWSLFGMALLAGSRWLFTINRTAMATIDETILLTVFILYFYIRAMRRNNMKDYIITGFLSGLAMHLHTGARVLPLIIGADILIRLIRLKSIHFKRRFINSGVLIFCAIIAFAPMGLYIVGHFEDYMKRSGETLLSREYPGSYTVEPYLKNIQYYLEMYVVRGDWHPRHNYPRTPQLATVVSVLSSLGLFLSLGTIRRHPVHRLLFSGFCLITLQGVLTVHGDGANLNRVAENIPIVFAWAVMGAMFVHRGITAVFRRRSGRFVSMLLMTAALLSSWLQEYHIYFNKYLPWKGLAEVYGFQPDIVEMAHESKRILESDPNVRVWSMYAGGDPFHYFLSGHERLHALPSDHLPNIEPGPVVFLIPANERNTEKRVMKAFPHARKTTIYYSLNPKIPLITKLAVDFSGTNG